MKKEQLLLVAAAGVAGLLVFTSMGRYQSVGAGSVPDGVDAQLKGTVQSNWKTLLDRQWPGGRNQFQEDRPEERKPRPSVNAPEASGASWARPNAWPYLPASHFHMLREEMKKLATVPAAAAAAEETGAAPEAEDDPEKVAAEQKRKDDEAKQAMVDARKAAAARVVSKDGREQICRLAPLGAHEGKPVWVILEEWPNVRFRVEELNEQDALTPRGSYDVGPDNIERYQTVHLEKTLENEYHEERIRRGLRADDSGANQQFAQWIVSSLVPKYGPQAAKLAIQHLRRALAAAQSAALVREAGAACQLAWDLESEIQIYLDYLKDARANDPAVLVLLGDAYERSGAVHAARDAFAKAAAQNDIEGRLRLGGVLLRLAGSAREQDAAFDEFGKVVGVATGTPKARALAGQAHARYRQGRVRDALGLAQQAAAADPASWHGLMILGACQYALGQFAEAEKNFSAAIPFEARGGSRARSNRGFALLALDKGAEAAAEFDKCLAEDPLNFTDPLIGLGETWQRAGDLTRADDTFGTALQTDPANAWTLLRIAAARFRDGRATDALRILQGGDGAPGLLQLAPELVDGFRIGGLASASLETPDHAAALKLLGRALQKESDPDARTIIVYDLARAQLAAGKTEDAVRLLETETNASGGAARNDAGCLALLAYAYFRAGQPVESVNDALNRTGRARKTAWSEAYVTALRDVVNLWDQTRIWRDEFNRSGGQVGNGWEATEGTGKTRIQLNGQSVVFKGSGVGEADRARQTSLTRNEEQDRFIAADCSVKAGPGFEFAFHVYTGALAVRGASGGRGRGQGAEFGLGRDRNGRMCWFIYGAAGGGGAQAAADRYLIEPLKDAAGAEINWPDDGQFHRIRIERKDHAKGVYEVYLDEQKVAASEPFEVGGLSLQRNKKMVVGFHVDGDRGVDVDLQVDRVEIEKLQAR
ncbi:MAG: hypothetical protein HMLKMBBP_01347 [Planctomycetes bacterium]|nr:hypothetical protein [Planctomycetota bacterium]